MKPLKAIVLCTFFVLSVNCDSSDAQPNKGSGVQTAQDIITPQMPPLQYYKAVNRTMVTCYCSIPPHHEVPHTTSWVIDCSKIPKETHVHDYVPPDYRAKSD